ncbi:MAG: hypothetical protein HOH43_25255 [Candidatus Latescibacteria bacterium]|jgi:fatty acid desaturase|nr:hypothetical protein [Candidatus Latescibacterota bacterium]
MGTPLSKPSPNPDVLADEDVLTEGPAYNAPQKKTRLKWYRCKLTREQLGEMNRRSDFLGFVQTLGFLLILAVSAGAAIYSSKNWSWYVTAMLVFVNGHLWQFLVNGFHELVHDSVFKTRWLNKFFLWVFSFLGWHNHHLFWASHTEHHKYTLHPPDDQEVVLPQRFDLGNFWHWSIINFRYPDTLIRGQLKKFAGFIDMSNAWTASLLPESDPERRRAFTNWERFLLIGHLLIAAASVASGYWIVLLVFTFPKTFGVWLQWLCNQAQHAGLKDEVEDYRLCCRTIYLNSVVQFLYWHMNYHTEHHMYAAVPCYRLPRLHKIIKHEMPHCPNGLRETWRLIAEIQDRQDQEPEYQFEAKLPAPVA